MLEVKEIQVKNILVRSNIPGIDYVINPYVGCRFGCIYCYASFMGRFHNKKISDWGQYVFPKINAPILLKSEIKKLKNNGKGVEIFMSSVTDPYQGLEAKYRLTRKCLEIIADSNFQGVVSILTKSDLVTRDIDLFKKINKILVGMTITSTNDSISRYFERYAPAVSDRLLALEKLNNNNIKTYAFIGPLLPHFAVKEDQIDKLLQKINNTGTKDVFIEHLNLTTYIKNRLTEKMKGVDQKLIGEFYISQSKNYREKIEKIIKSKIEKHKMKLLMDMVIYHKEFQVRPGVKNIEKLTKI